MKQLNIFASMKRIKPIVIKRKPEIKRITMIEQHYDKTSNKSLNGKELIDTLNEDVLQSMRPNFTFNLPKGDKNRLYIIGGGSSVLNQDLKKINDGDVMVINRAIEYVDSAKYFITMDYTFIRDKVNLKQLDKAEYRIFIMNTTEFMAQHKGVFYDSRFGLVYQKMNLFHRVYDSKYTVAPGTGFGLTDDAFAHGENSGFCALQLGILLGYEEIVLLGFDLTITNKTHFHGGYGQNPGAFVKKLTRYLIHYETAFKLLPVEYKSKIFSASNKSKLNTYIQFKNLKFEENSTALPFTKEMHFPSPEGPAPEIETIPKEDMKRNTLDDLMVVGYYTVNTPYEQEAKKTIASCVRLGLNHDIVGVKNLGSWQANTRFKAKFMLDMLEKHMNKRLLYVDCDAVINELPVLFKDYEADVAVRWQDFRWRANECLSGTIYLENNEKTKKLCRMWLDINETQGMNAKGFEQWNLGTAIETMKATDGLIAKNLPPEYCQFDLIEKIYPNLKKGRGVIQHFQKSRIYKGLV